MVDANKSTELWRHPSVNNILPIRGEIYSGEWNISLIKIMFFYADDDNHVLEYTLHKSLTFFEVDCWLEKKIIRTKRSGVSSLHFERGRKNGV